MSHFDTDKIVDIASKKAVFKENLIALEAKNEVIHHKTLQYFKELCKFPVILIGFTFNLGNKKSCKIDPTSYQSSIWSISKVPY